MNSSSCDGGSRKSLGIGSSSLSVDCVCFGNGRWSGSFFLIWVFNAVFIFQHFVAHVETFFSGRFFSSLFQSFQKSKTSHHNHNMKVTKEMLCAVWRV